VIAKAAKVNKTAAKTTKTVAKARAKTRKEADANPETLDPGADLLP
jgi:hypothetical protein